jgi:hypothetical protein
MHGDPWRWLRRLSHIEVLWADLPGDLLGQSDFETDTITLALGMTQAERRSVCWHEVLHLQRGPVPEYLEQREELAVDAAVARDLIPLSALVDAMVWSADEWEIADELTVSVDLVRVRLHDLTAAETEALNRALDAAESRLP